MTRPDPFDAPGLPRLPRTRWEVSSAVPGIEPRNGWAIHFASGQVRTGWQGEEYEAVHEDGRTELLQHCRWHFTPTQERWDWLCAGNLKFNPVKHGVLMPFNDADIDAEIEKESRA